MDVKHPSTGEPSGEPGPIPFSMRLPHQVLEGAIAISHDVGDPDVVMLDVQLSGKRLASASLTEESALHLALRLIATIMNSGGRHECHGPYPAAFRSSQGGDLSNLCRPDRIEYTCEVAVTDIKPGGPGGNVNEHAAAGLCCQL